MVYFCFVLFFNLFQNFKLFKKTVTNNRLRQVLHELELNNGYGKKGHFITREVISGDLTFLRIPFTTETKLKQIAQCFTPVVPKHFAAFFRNKLTFL